MRRTVGLPNASSDEPPMTVFTTDLTNSQPGTHSAEAQQVASNAQPIWPQALSSQNRGASFPPFGIFALVVHQQHYVQNIAIMGALPQFAFPQLGLNTGALPQINCRTPPPVISHLSPTMALPIASMTTWTSFPTMAHSSLDLHYPKNLLNTSQSEDARKRRGLCRFKRVVYILQNC